MLSGAAVERVNNSVLKELVITDSIDAAGPRHATAARSATSAARRLIGEAIRRIANEESVSKLFD